jgi:hypothetical protein
MYWEYDSRIGRRWNVDRVVKAPLSSYLCFSGSPISRVDKNGADDYFDSFGNFLFSTKKGTQIKVIRTWELSIAMMMSKDSEGTITTLARAMKMAVPLNTAEYESRSEFYNAAKWVNTSKILTYYGKQVGVKGDITTYAEEGQSEIVAETSGGKERGVSVNTNYNSSGKISNSVNDIGGLKATLSHEMGHQIEGASMSFLDHANIYLNYDINTNYFKSIKDADVKWGTLGSYANHILNHLVDTEGSTSGELEKKARAIEKTFNDKKTGYTISIYLSPYASEQNKVGITNTKTNEARKVEYNKLESYSE